MSRQRTQQRLDAAIDHLYEVPLAAFTRERDALAATLKSEGDGGSAKAVKALRKPSLAAWAVNQLVRRDPEEVRELLELRERLRDATSAGDIRRLTASRNAMVTQLVRRAEMLLSEAGHSATSQTVERISQTLFAAGVTAAAEAIARGRLTRELVATGFEQVEVQEAIDPVVSDEVREVSPKETERLAATAHEAEGEAERLAAAAVEADAEAVRAEEQAARARAEAARARDRADAAHRRANEARAAAEDALLPENARGHEASSSRRGTP
jgi:hypothetical protein